MSDRYKSDGTQAESRSGSEGQVLANRLGTADIDGIDEAELLLLLQLYGPDRAYFSFPDNR